MTNFLRNWVLKAFSLMVAILLYLFVNSEANTSVIELIVPVEVRNLAKDTILIAPQEPQARVSIRGPTSLVMRIASSPPAFRINLPEQVGNSFVATLHADLLSLPPYVRVQRVEPVEIDLAFDKLAERQLPVVVPQIGEVSPGYTLESLEVSPQQVLVRGPRVEVHGLTRIETAPLDLREIGGDFERELSVRVPGNYSEVSPSMIKVRGRLAHVEQRVEFKRLSIELRAAPSPNDLRVDPQDVAVEVIGPVGKIEALKVEEVVPYVRMRAGLSEGAEVSVAVDLPAGLRVSTITPDRVHVVRVAAGGEKKRGVR